MTELNDLLLMLGNVRTTKKYAYNSDMELLAIEEELVILQQINNFYRKQKLTGMKGEIDYAVQSKECRDWNLRCDVVGRSEVARPSNKKHSRV